jgi:hypothetical protein
LLSPIQIRKPPRRMKINSVIIRNKFAGVIMLV